MNRGVLWLSLACGATACPTEPPASMPDTAAPLPENDPGTTTEAPADWVLADPKTCTATAPEGLPHFTQQAAAALTATGPEDNTDTLFEGGGLTVADLNGDGWHDLFLPGKVMPQLLWGNAEGNWTPAPDALPDLPPEAWARGTGSTAADTDGDGDLDLVLTRFREPNLLLRNDGGVFVDDTATAGIAGDPIARSTSASLADVDNDGDLDLFIANYGQFFVADRPPGDASVLYENLGDGVFQPWPAALPQALHDGYTFVAGWPDLNGDGRRELYTVNDFGSSYPNVLLWNEPAGFRVDFGLSGLNLQIDGMGLDWGDLDGDGDIDLVAAGWGNNRLMLREGDTWFDTHVPAGLVGTRDLNQRIGWSTVAADFDLDGDLDIAQGFGAIYNQDGPKLQPDAVFVQQAPLEDGLPQYLEDSVRAGFSNMGQTRGVLTADLNQDGTPDLVRRDLTGPATVHLAACAPGAWLTVRPRQPGTANPFAVGAQVEAHLEDRVVRAEVRAGGHVLMGSGPMEAHLGLGAVDRVSRLVVRWPDGQVSTLPDVMPRRAVNVTRLPESP